MNDMYFINESIYDVKLIESLNGNEQLKLALNQKLEYENAKCYDIKKLLSLLYPFSIFPTIYISKRCDIPTLDEEKLKLLKNRKEIYDFCGTKGLDKILLFYQNKFKVRENEKYYPLSSLNEYIDLFNNISNSAYKKLYNMYLIPNIIDDICNRRINDFDTIKELLSFDVKLVNFISNDFDKKDELIRYMLDNNYIEVDYIFNNCKNEFKTNKDFLIKMILNSPKSYKYFDHNIIDFEMIKKLIDSYYPNSYYRNFCSDPRFYKFFYKLEDRELNNKKYIGKRDNQIVDVISKYIPLTKSGSDYLGLCPFHDDRNPSLRVSPKKGVWKCFSCGAGGNANYFVSKYTTGTNAMLMQNSIYSYNKNIKNQFIYYLYSNIPNSLKNNKEVAKYFLSIDGCLIKLFPRELKYDNELADIAMGNDLTSFRYIMYDRTLKNKYLKDNILLEYYLPNNEKSNEYREISKKYIHISPLDFSHEIFGDDPFDELQTKFANGEIDMKDIKIEVVIE